MAVELTEITSFKSFIATFKTLIREIERRADVPQIIMMEGIISELATSLETRIPIDPSKDISTVEYWTEMIYYIRLSFSLYNPIFNKIINEEGLKRAKQLCAFIFRSRKEIDGQVPSASKAKTQLYRTAGINPESVLVSDFTNERYVPCFVLYRNNARKELTLVIRGSFSENDWISDFTALPALLQTPPPHSRKPLMAYSPGCGVEDPGDWCHSGMLASSYQIHAQVGPTVIKELEALAPTATLSDPWSFVLCGQSLGAGVASLLGLIYRRQQAAGTFPPTIPVRVYGFGTPACASGRLSDELMRGDPKHTVNVVYRTDMVPRASVHAMTVLGQRINENQELPFNGDGSGLLDFRARIAKKRRKQSPEVRPDGESDKDRRGGGARESTASISRRFTLPTDLFVPGHVQLMLPRRQGHGESLLSYSVFPVGRHDVGELVVSGDMAGDHGGYLSAATEVGLGLGLLTPEQVEYEYGSG
eukprot:gnl/Dysnectes_brevis/7441_a12450_223.p1 GENE.gnl/Dysnectes_brevis/7441_a12450_223~~gnl/Dysnectes_brevis/7441_a12450_223.p1  ORF type:complete len:476 (+),score=123.54 gnl/Dysnectes_brevis/7441_a12450_223:77-1504(+)